MVAPFLRLRVSILGNTFRRTGRSRALFILGLVLAVTLAVLLAWVPTLIAGDDQAFLADLDVMVGSVLLALALLIPFFVNGRLLHPKQFQTLPLSSRTVSRGMYLATFVSWPAFLFVVWLVSLFLLRESFRAVPWAGALACAVVLLFAAALVRFGAGLSQFLFASPKSREVRGIVGAILVLSVLPLSFFLFTGTQGHPLSGTARDIANVAGWTPFGAPFAAVGWALQGDQLTALMLLAGALVCTVFLLLLVGRITAASLVRVDRPIAHTLSRTGLGWFDRFSARPAGLIGARMVTYWIRDPRYRVALIALPFAPVVMVIALAVAGMSWQALALIPLPVVLFLLAWSVHNDVATDSTAIWSHVVSATRGRDDRLGRLIPVLLLGVPLVLIGSSITVAVMGDWRALPAVLGMGFGVLFVGCGVSSVSSALAPYPTTRPGDSPFVQPQWSGSGAGLAQTLSMTAAVLLSLPVMILSGMAVEQLELGLQIAALIFGIVFGLVIMVIGVLVGGRIFQRRGPEILALSQIFD